MLGSLPLPVRFINERKAMRAQPVLNKDQGWFCPGGEKHNSDDLSRYVGMIPNERLDPLGEDFNDDPWFDATNIIQSYENNFPGADVWLDTSCDKIVGYCRDGLNIDWNGESEVWACASCSKEYPSLAAADSCCLRDREAIHYAVEYGFLDGARVDLQINVVLVDENGKAVQGDLEEALAAATADPTLENMTKLRELADSASQEQKISGLEPDIPLDQQYDYDAIAKKH